jgi:hypothetical protein
MPDPHAPRKRVASCCCGSLRLEAEGEPKTVAMCSCEQCQRRTGSVMNVSAYWLRDRVQVSGGSARYARAGDSGGEVTFHFCPNCGSTVYWHLPDFDPSLIGVAVGCFADPGFPAPTLSLWEKTMHPWVSPPTPIRLDGQRPAPTPPVG